MRPARRTTAQSMAAATAAPLVGPKVGNTCPSSNSTEWPLMSSSAMRDPWPVGSATVSRHSIRPSLATNAAASATHEAFLSGAASRPSSAPPQLSMRPTRQLTGCPPTASPAAQHGGTQAAGLEAPTQVGSLDVVGAMSDHETGSIGEHGVERSMHGSGSLRVEAARPLLQY